MARHFNSTATTASSSFSPATFGMTSFSGASGIPAFSGAAIGPLISASMGTLNRQQSWGGGTTGFPSRSMAASVVVRSTGSFPGMGTGSWAGLPSSSAGGVHRSAASLPASILRRVNFTDDEAALLTSATAPPPSGRSSRH